MIRVHRNLHAARQNKPQWVETQKYTDEHGKRRSRSVYHARMILLNVTTRIQPAAAAKCIESNVRRVCAFFDGTRATLWEAPPGGWQRVGYDPRTGGGFTASATEWTHADAVYLTEGGAAYALNPTNPGA